MTEPPTPDELQELAQQLHGRAGQLDKEAAQYHVVGEQEDADQAAATADDLREAGDALLDIADLVDDLEVLG
jgi:hypothetical protein